MKKILTTLALSALVLAGCSSASPTKPSSMPSAQPTSASPTSGKIAGFVAADLATHAAETDCWVSIDGSVYDLTSYINVHPGGTQVIIKNCGKDATEAFHTMDGKGHDHPDQAADVLKNYYKGVLQ